MNDFREFGLYIWVFIFSLIVGVLSFFKKRPVDTKFRFWSFVVGVGCSMVMGYVTFELSFFYFEKEKVAIAIAGVGAWMGTDGLLSLEGAFLNIITRKSKGE